MPSFFLMIPRPPRSPLFPYTPLFRSATSLLVLAATTGEAQPRSREDCEAAYPADRKSTRLNSSHGYISYAFFFFNDPATPEIPSLSLHAALPICYAPAGPRRGHRGGAAALA